MRRVFTKRFAPVQTGRENEMKTFKDKFGDEVTAAQWFEDIAISTKDDTGLSMFIFRATTAREIAAELIRIADVIEEDE